MYQDPGWQRVLRLIPRTFIPGGLSRKVREGSADIGKGEGPLTPIEVMRLFYISFPMALFLILFVLPFLSPEASGSMSMTAATAMLVAVAAASYSAITILRDRGEPVTTPEEALDRYRTRMFILIALAEPLAMIGFVLVFVTGSPARYWIGLALAVPGLYIAAPNRASIERFQDKFGGAVDVLAALTR